CRSLLSNFKPFSAADNTVWDQLCVNAQIRFSTACQMQSARLRRTQPGQLPAKTGKAELEASASLGHDAFERLVGFLGELRIEIAEPGRLGHEGLVGLLHIVGLDAERVLEGLRRKQ